MTLVRKKSQPDAWDQSELQVRGFCEFHVIPFTDLYFPLSPLIHHPCQSRGAAVWGFCWVSLQSLHTAAWRCQDWIQYGAQALGHTYLVLLYGPHVCTCPLCSGLAVSAADCLNTNKLSDPNKIYPVGKSSFTETSTTGKLLPEYKISSFALVET